MSEHVELMAPEVSGIMPADASFLISSGSQLKRRMETEQKGVQVGAKN